MAQPVAAQPGYPPAGQPGYPPVGQPGYYPPPGQPGYPPAGQPGYPPAGQPGYPPAGQPGYAPQPGYAGGYQQGAPVMQQPTAGPVQWMPAVQQAPEGCPPGLEYLTQIDQLIVKQQMELFEMFTGIETNNKYQVQNSLGQTVYFAAEDFDLCMLSCGPARAFEMKILDNTNREVIHLSRPCRCQGCCCPCCLQEIEVQSPPGTPVGYVIQQWSFCDPKFEIQDADHNPVLLIEGPGCPCGGDIEFKVLALDGAEQIGKISKQWSGFIKEAYTNADTFGITFPMDLDVKVKATMFGAVFLIDFMFFEKSRNQQQQQQLTTMSRR